MMGEVYRGCTCISQVKYCKQQDERWIITVNHHMRRNRRSEVIERSYLRFCACMRETTWVGKPGTAPSRRDRDGLISLAALAKNGRSSC